MNKIKSLLLIVCLLAGAFCNTSLAAAIDLEATNDVEVTDNDENGLISIGDEFCLGEECFYVLSYEDGVIKALAKHNLHAGGKSVEVAGQADFTDVADGRIQRSNAYKHGYYDCNWEYNDGYSTYSATVCYIPFNMSIQTYELPDGINPIGMRSNNFWGAIYDVIDDASHLDCIFDTAWNGSYYTINVFYGCYTYDTTYEPIKQDANAISAHGDEHGKPEFPSYGDQYLLGGGRYDQQNNLIISRLYADWFLQEDGLPYGDNEDISYYLYSYYDDLTEDYDIEDINLLSFNQLVDILNRINTVGATFEENDYYAEDLFQWEEHINPEDCLHSYAYWAASLLDYIPKEYDWLYSTTYWLSTIYYDLPTDDEMQTEQDGTQYVYRNMNYQFFIDTLGDLCSVDGACGGMSIGAGIRPTITIDTNTAAQRYLLRAPHDVNPATLDEISRSVLNIGAAFFITLSGFAVIKKRR